MEVPPAPVQHSTTSRHSFRLTCHRNNQSKTKMTSGSVIRGQVNIHSEIRESLKLNPEFVIHSLRHAMLTRLGESGADAFTIMKIAGQSSVSMSQRYSRPTPEAMEKATEPSDSMNHKALSGGARIIETTAARRSFRCISRVSARKSLRPA